jgi:hypothetical protein
VETEHSVGQAFKVFPNYRRGLLRSVHLSLLPKVRAEPAHYAGSAGVSKNDVLEIWRRRRTRRSLTIRACRALDVRLEAAHQGEAAITTFLPRRGPRPR